MGVHTLGSSVATIPINQLGYTFTANTYNISLQGLQTDEDKEYDVRTLIMLPTTNSIVAFATYVGDVTFRANWNKLSGASSYYLDISLDPYFGSYLTGYSSKNVGDVSVYDVYGLTLNTPYYFRVRSIGATGGDLYSNTVKLNTLNYEVKWEYSIVRNQEMDATLSLATSTLLDISHKVGQVLTIDNLPDYDKFDDTGWVAMLSDTDKTNTGPDPVASGDYLYKYFCTVDRVAKTLTFDAADSLADWEEGDNLVLYNPFINYTFVGDQVNGPFVSVSGAPAWRSFQSYTGPMFRHSDGRFIAILDGFEGGSGPTYLGYMESTDMVTWTVGNSDNYVWDPQTAVGDTRFIVIEGQALRLSDGRYCLPFTQVRDSDGINIPRLLYFNEDLTTFTFTDAVIATAGLGFTAGGLALIDGTYYLGVYYIHPAGSTSRIAQVYSSATLEGPYLIFQDDIAQGITAVDGCPWQSNAGPFVILFDGRKYFALMDCTNNYALTGSKNNRNFSLWEMDTATHLWSPSHKGHTFINPFYFHNIMDGDYRWAGDHGGPTVSMYVDGGDAYIYTCTRTTATYEMLLGKLNYSY